jgi:hypothetical protein
LEEGFIKEDFGNAVMGCGSLIWVHLDFSYFGVEAYVVFVVKFAFY